jgi:tRNA A-37 threonylcarbamoyl transferase component Bud32
MTVSQDPYSGDQSSHASSVPTKAEASQVATASHSVQETLRPQSGRMRPGTGTARASPLEGLGRYRILKLLGQGAMGAVYLAEDTELQRQVALKVPKFVSPDAGDERERFYREARLAATLHHPNICPVYDIGEHQGTRYITMAYLVGPPLSQLVGTESLKAERTVAWVLRKIALALAEAHAKGVVHRDLKPGNILLDERHEPVVTDFGLAQRVGQSTDSRLTQRDALVGTPAYMAPEQISGDPARIGPACDTYALGVMLYEFLTGQLPYRGSITSVLGQILQGQPQRPCALRPDLDPELERICLKLMALTPAERYGSATEAAAVLTKWLEQVPATPARNASEEAPSTVDVAVVGKPAVGGADRSDVVRWSPTPHTAPTAGLPPAAPNLDAQRRLYDYRQQTIALLRQGQFAAVLDRLERMTRIFGPGTEPYIAWAQRELAKVKALPPLVLQKGPTLVAEGTRRLATQDFAGVIGLLEPLPAEYRSPEAEQLLQQARTLQAEVEQLNAHVQRAVRERRYDGLRPALQRLLQLEPGNLVARDLFERLGTYAPGEAWRFDEDGHLMPGRAHDRWLDRLARLLHYRLLRRRPTPASRAPSQWAEVKALPLPKDSLLSPGLFLALGLLLALFAGAYYAGTSFLETARVSSTVPTPSPSTDPTPKPEPKPEPKSATEPNTELRPEMPPVAVAPFDAKHAKPGPSTGACRWWKRIPSG